MPRAFVIILLILSVRLHSQVPGASTQEYTVSVQQFGIEEGLAHRIVTKVYKDKNGFLWIFGYRTPLRYDGYEFKPYSIDAINTDNMGEVEEGLIWMVRNHKNSTSTLVFLNPLTGDVLSLEERRGSVIANQMAPLLNKQEYHFYDDQGKNKKEQWYFGGKHHIVLFDVKTGLKKIPVPNVEAGPIQIALIDHVGNFWIHGKNGMIRKLSPNGVLLDSVKLADRILDGPFCFKAKSVFEWEGHVYLRDESGPKNQLFRIGDSGEKQLVYEDPEGYCFFEFLEGQIWCLGPDGWKIFDTQGDLMLELKREGYDKKLFEVLTVGGIKSDGTGKFYLYGSFGFNIIEIQKNPFTHYFSEDGETRMPINNEARGIYAENDSVLVNFENGGLVLFNKREPSAYKILYDLKKEAELGGVGGTGLPIIRDGTKNFWSKSEYHLTKWSPDLSVQQQVSFSSPSQTSNTWSLWEDETGCIWFFTVHGFGKICPDELTPTEFTGFDEAGFDFKHDPLIYHIQPDHKGLLWLCSESGLFVFDREQKKVVGHYHDAGKGEYYLPDHQFYHMHVDADENRWLGTQSGLLFWNPTTGEKKLFGRKDGLSNELIYAVYEDDYNRLWLNSEYGIMSFDKATFEVQTYLVKDGITDIEANRTSHFQEADGTIYFGSVNGVNAFHPRDFVKREKDHPKLAIVDFEIFDGHTETLVNKLTEIIATQTITFHPSDRFFKLKFTLPTLDDIRKTLYAWKIDGVYSDWNYQKENTLQFGALPYGNHRLRIKGQSAGGGWSPYELDIQIRVLKPFYLQMWFIILSVLALISSVFWYVKKRTRLLLAQSEGLRQLDKVKSRFFANISHEFRTPLTLILGPVTQALKHSKQLSAPAMDLIQRNGSQLLRLINQILDLSKMEEGKMNTFYVRGDSIALLRRMVEPFEAFARANQKQLTFRSSLPVLEMDYDKQKLHDILSNLLSNALKFTREGDTIEVSAGQANSSLFITVKDSGIGIAEEYLPYIFDRFHQVENSRPSSPIKGSGIGLSFTKQMAELMGGSIKVESRLGEGSTFILSLPIHLLATQKDEDFISASMALPVPLQAAPKIKKYIEPRPIAGKGPVRVLIVEDTPDLAQYIASCLPETYQVSFAENGQTGIDWALEEIPDIVISDVMMPEKDGFELCQTLKNDVLTSHIPIILLTALADADARIMGLKRGADAYLAKPFDEEELQVRIVKLLELRQTLRKRFSHLAIDPEASPTAEEQQNPDLELEDAFILKIRDIVSKQYPDPEFDVNRFVEQAGMSETQFRRKLSALTGASPNNFIQSFRLEKARQLLKQTELNISEISFQTGFSDPSYFSRVFLRNYEVSPRDFRKTLD